MTFEFVEKIVNTLLDQYILIHNYMATLIEIKQQFQYRFLFGLLLHLVVLRVNFPIIESPHLL